jgi:Carboxypeptidase regulatory-like domain
VRPAILLLLLSAALSAQPAGIDGVVVNHATGQPLSGVHVRLITGDAFGFDIADRAYGAISDKAGRFSITGMKPGVYTLTLERAGYLQARTAVPDTMVALKAGQNLTGQKLEMNPRAIIMGRVVDDSGDPVQRVEVIALPVQSDRGSPPFLSRSMAATDERGEFQILVSPGRYGLQASPRMPDNDVPPEIRSDGSSPASYNVTYYPSAAEAGSGTLVDAAAGQDVSGIEIHLRAFRSRGARFQCLRSGRWNSRWRPRHCHLTIRRQCRRALRCALQCH